MGSKFYQRFISNLINYFLSFFRKASDAKVPRIDKALEDIFSIFNQIELHLVSLCYSLTLIKRMSSCTLVLQLIISAKYFFWRKFVAST